MPYYGKEDIRPELHAPEHRDLVSFDKFTGFEKSVDKFNNTLKNFEGSENQFFDAIIYGIMFCKSNGEIIDKNKIAEVVGEDFYNDLLQIKDEIKLDRTLFGYFDRCFLANQVVAKHSFFKNFLNDEICSGFLSKKKRYKEKMKSQETFLALSLKNLMNVK